MNNATGAKVDYQDFNDDTTEFVKKLKRVLADINIRIAAVENIKSMLDEFERRYGEVALVRIDAAIAPVLQTMLDGLEETRAALAALDEDYRTNGMERVDTIIEPLIASSEAALAAANAQVEALDQFLAAKQSVSERGQPNGYAALGADGKVPMDQLPAAVLGAVSYQETWDASTNTPAIPAATSANKGHYYKVSVAGATSIDGITDWRIGDWLISNGATWDKIDNTDQVLSIAGLMGAITAAALKTALAIGVADVVGLQSALSDFRNKVINGDFDIWQRATSQTGNSYGSDDRWRNDNIGSTKTHSRQAFTVGQTDVPGNPRFYSRTVVTSVAGAGNYALKQQAIEDVRSLAGKTATLTFYAKADAAKNIATEFFQMFGTGGAPSATVAFIGVQQFALTTSWQKFSVLIAIPSIAGKTLGTNGNDYLAFRFWFEAGSNSNANTGSLGQQSGTFDIAHVSVVEGDATGEADPFSPRHIQQEGLLVRRYYYSAGAVSGPNGYPHRVLNYAASAASLGIGAAHPVPMRATPTRTITWEINDVVQGGAPTSWGAGVHGWEAINSVPAGQYIDVTAITMDAEL